MRISLARTKISLVMIPAGIGLLFLPIWWGPAEVAPVGVGLLLGGLLLLNKARTGSFTGRPGVGGVDHDWLDSEGDVSTTSPSGGGELGGGGASGGWDDDDDDD